MPEHLPPKLDATTGYPRLSPRTPATPVPGAPSLRIPEDYRLTPETAHLAALRYQQSTGALPPELPPLARDTIGYLRSRYPKARETRFIADPSLRQQNIFAYTTRENPPTITFDPRSRELEQTLGHEMGHAYQQERVPAQSKDFWGRPPTRPTDLDYLSEDEDPYAAYAEEALTYNSRPAERQAEQVGRDMARARSTFEQARAMFPLPAITRGAHQQILQKK